MQLTATKLYGLTIYSVLTWCHSLFEINTKSHEMSRKEGNFLLYRALAIHVHCDIIHNAVFCKESFRNNFDRFRSGSAHELYCLKARAKFMLVLTRDQ